MLQGGGLLCCGLRITTTERGVVLLSYSLVTNGGVGFVCVGCVRRKGETREERRDPVVSP